MVRVSIPAVEMMNEKNLTRDTRGYVSLVPGRGLVHQVILRISDALLVEKGIDVDRDYSTYFDHSTNCYIVEQDDA